MKAGLLLLAHGARDPGWAQPFEQVRARLAQRCPDAAVELAFLEFMEPGLAGAAARLVAAGCARVEVVPLFLGVGGHVRRDVPAGVQALRAAHPQVEFALGASVGEDAGVLDAIAAACARRFAP